DLEILSLLEKDSRVPWRRIARELEVSESTVYMRVKRLQEQGILEGFTVKLNRRKLGLDVVLFILIRAEAGKIRELREDLRKIPYLCEAHQITGEYHFLVKVTAPNREAAGRVLDEIASLPGVQDIRILFSLHELMDGSNIASMLLEWASRG
nr:Lrp/AsnC family transcriptional regulator [Desulfurococcales archaeon]